MIFEAPSKQKNLADILSVSRGLPDHVGKRQLEAAEKLLTASGTTIEKRTLDISGVSLSKGSSILVYRAMDDVLIGSSSLGEIGKTAEKVGDESARLFLDEIGALPNVDSHLADMLVTLLSCVNGRSVFRTSSNPQ